MSIEHGFNPFQPHKKSEFLRPQEVSRSARGLLDSFQQYVNTTGQKTKPFIEERESDGWEWNVAFKVGKTKKSRELLIQRREAGSEDPFTRVVIDAHTISFHEPGLNISNVISNNTQIVIDQASEFVETFTHPSPNETENQ